MITWDFFMWVNGIEIAVILGAYVYTFLAVKGIREEIESNQRTLHGRIGDHGRRLDDYRLEAQKEFVSVGHLREVEERLVKAIDGMREDIRELTKAMTNHFVNGGGKP